MKPSILFTGLQVTVMGLLYTQVLAQSPSSQSASSTAQLGAIQTLGCYSSPGPLKQDNTNTFQSSGNCQQACGLNEAHAVMAITGGSTCYCGDILPGLDKLVAKSNCNSPCQGFGQQTCGGIGYWQVYLTGLTGDVQTAPNSTSSSSSSSVTSTHAVQSTVIVTASATAGADGSSSGPNKVGIAVGVVVGVVAIMGIVGAGIFYMKQQKRKEIEAEHKAAAAVNSFVGSRSSDSKSDQRLDPSMASFRRASIGSIADERDFSRRILQVRNPDRGSMNSMA